MKLRIDRATWLRGEDPAVLKTGGSYLLRPKDGRMCCLGFLCRDLGWPLHELAHVTMPDLLIDADGAQDPAAVCLLPKWLVEKGTGDGDPDLTPLVETMANTNDDPRLTETEREAKLTELFARQGIEVEFFGESPNYPVEANPLA
jgi:hypothetical protein